MDWLTTTSPVSLQHQTLHTSPVCNLVSGKVDQNSALRSPVANWVPESLNRWPAPLASARSGGAKGLFFTTKAPILGLRNVVRVQRPLNFSALFLPGQGLKKQNSGKRPYGPPRCRMFLALTFSLCIQSHQARFCVCLDLIERKNICLMS
jgi:hypothetical protein